MGARRTEHLFPRPGWKFAGARDAWGLGHLLNGRIVKRHRKFGQLGYTFFVTPPNAQPYAAMDVNWMGRPKSSAAALVQSDGVNALIDPGPTSSLETLRAELQRHGLRVQDLHAILLTHIHL